MIETDTQPASKERTGTPQLERRPRSGQDRVHMEHGPAWAEPHEPEGESLPRAAHGGEMQALGRWYPSGHRGPCGRRDAVASTALSHSPTLASSEAWVAGDSELPWAVRGS